MFTTLHFWSGFILGFLAFAGVLAGALWLLSRIALPAREDAVDEL